LRHVILARDGMDWTDFGGQPEARTFFAAMSTQ
jgi:hypothetical protein